ncbi:MAG: histidine kinase [Chitinophagaceae bacterium]
MKWIKPGRLQLISFLISMPIIDLAIQLILYQDRVWQDWKIWIVSYPLVFLLGTFSWYGHVAYADKVERRFPLLSQSRQRILCKALVVLLIMPPSVLLIFFIFDQFHILGYQVKNWDLLKGLILGFSVNLVFETLYESDYMLGKYKDSLMEKESLRQLSLQQEFDTLKGQVNPHFLFNCFNTLSSLISEDKEKADAFLNELSKVYRYLLRNNEDGLSTVQNEIRFIESYYRLLQTRHGEAVQVNIEIDKRYDAYLLPSLSLQLLVENVVKHNVLSKNKPLIIDIFTTAGNKLVVNNNLQCRSVKAPSNKVGLENIRAKYALLEQPGFQVLEDKNNFTVVLPLIWNNSSGNRQRMMGLQQLEL